METQKVKAVSLIEKLKQKAAQTEPYGGKTVVEQANLDVNACPGCGAGRAKEDGLTKCAYCGHEFMEVMLTDGIYVKKEDNSR